MRRTFPFSISVALLATLTGCDSPLWDTASRLVPVDAETQAKIVTTRYQAGEYPGTVNDTLNNPHVVYHFTYVNGVSLWAMTLLSEELDDARLKSQVAASLELYDRDRLYRPGLGDEPIDYLGSMAHATLVYSLRTGDQRFLDNALESARYFKEDAARTPAGLVGYHDNPARGRIWADALFMFGPLMAKAGTALGDPSYHDDVLDQVFGYTERLRNPATGLYRQAWNWHGEGPTPGFWGRANGWVALALTEILDSVPSDHPARGDLLALYQDFMADIVAHQGTGGMWHQLLDRPDSYEETSCTGMFLYAISRGIERGWLPGEYADAVRRGHDGLSRMLSLAGDISNVCPGTPPQSSEAAYFNRGPRRNDSHGIGPAMLGLYSTLTLPGETE